MPLTDLLIVHFFSFLFLLFSLLWNLLVSLTENPPNECAKMTRQINAPKWPAKISCRRNLPDSPARIIRRIYSPEKSAFSTRGLLARDPPFPAQNPQAGPGPPTLPPPPQNSANGAGGGGREPARPTHAYWTGTLAFILHFMNGYIFLYDTIHTYSTQSGLKWRYKILL